MWPDGTNPALVLYESTLPSPPPLTKPCRAEIGETCERAVPRKLHRCRRCRTEPRSGKPCERAVPCPDNEHPSE